MNRTSFDHPTHELHLDTYQAKDVPAALKSAIKLATERLETMLAIPSAERTYDNTVQALNDSTAELELVCDVVDHMSQVLAGDWQDQEKTTSELSTAFYTERSLNPKIYKALRTISEQREQLRLDEFQARLVEDMLAGFRRSGVNLPAAQRRQIQAIKLELTQLSTDFAQNLLQASDEASLTITDVAELDGIDQNLIDAWAAAAKTQKLDGYFIQFNAPTYQAVMSDCTYKPTREAMHRLSRTRAPQNESIARRMIELRGTLARMLGYKNYADYTTEYRMAKTGTRAQAFVDELTHAYHQTMLTETAALQTFARQLTGDENYQLDYTDVDSGFDMYFASQLRRQEFNTDPSIRLEEYFPIDQVLDTMFEALHTLYGVRCVEADEPTYRSDVKSYHVIDEDNRHISTVWCDWFARTGKRGGAWQHTVYVADRSQGRVDLPHMSFVCANFPAPSTGRPSLLTIQDVETLWHEFGHFMHCSLGRTELREQNGYECAWDFIEAPSQIMENWVWQDEILTKTARHYKTGKQLPPEYIDMLRSSRHFRAASTAMWTLYWAQVDLYLHTQYDATTKSGVNEVSRKIKTGYFGAPIAPYDTTVCTLAHIFAGGYAAGYYGYKWAESIEADLFSRFEKEGVLNPETGRAYRDLILARGDSVDAEVEIKDFLGRRTNIDAMLRRGHIKK